MKENNFNDQKLDNILENVYKNTSVYNNQNSSMVIKKSMRKKPYKIACTTAKQRRQSKLNVPIYWDSYPLSK